MNVKCPKCHKTLSIPGKLLGKTVKCPCGQPIKTRTTQPSKPSTQSPQTRLDGGPTTQAAQQVSPIWESQLKQFKASKTSELENKKAVAKNTKKATGKSWAWLLTTLGVTMILISVTMALIFLPSLLSSGSPIDKVNSEFNLYVAYVESALAKRNSAGAPDYEIVSSSIFASRTPKTLTFLTRSHQGVAVKKETASVQYSAEITMKIHNPQFPRVDGELFGPKYENYNFLIRLTAGYTSGVWKYCEPTISATPGSINPNWEERMRQARDKAGDTDSSSATAQLAQAGNEFILEQEANTEKMRNNTMIIDAIDSCRFWGIDKLWFQELSSTLNQQSTGEVAKGGTTGASDGRMSMEGTSTEASNGEMAMEGMSDADYDKAMDQMMGN